MKKYVSLTQASQLLNRSSEELQKMCQSGFLDAKVVGSEWFVNVDKGIGSTGSTPGRVTDLRQAAAMIMVVLFFSVGLTKLSAMMPERLAPPSVAQVSAVEVFDGWLEGLGDFVAGIPGMLDFVWDRLTANWHRFLGLTPTSPTLDEPIMATNMPPMPANTATLTSTEIQKLIDERVAAQLRQLGRSVSTVSSGSPSSGLVVVPSTGSAATDRDLRSRLGEAFSDRVVISLDPSGLTGIITPIFQRVAGENYLFLLTPVRPQ